MCERMVATLAQPGARVGSAQRQPGTGQNNRCREGAPRPLAGDRSRSRADPAHHPQASQGQGGLDWQLPRSGMLALASPATETAEDKGAEPACSNGDAPMAVAQLRGGKTEARAAGTTGRSERWSRPGGGFLPVCSNRGRLWPKGVFGGGSSGPNQPGTADPRNAVRSNAQRKPTDGAMRALQAAAGGPHLAEAVHQRS